MNKIYRKLLAGCLATLGFAACTTEEPDLYGPKPEYSEPKEVKQQSRSASTGTIDGQAEARYRQTSGRSIPAEVEIKTAPSHQANPRSIRRVPASICAVRSHSPP